MKRIVRMGLFVGMSLAAVAYATTPREYRYHGTVCKPAAAALTSVTYGSFGIQNDGSQPLLVTCPLPTRFENIPPGTGGSSGQDVISSGNVVVYDRSTTADVSCTLKAHLPDGTISFSQTVSSSNGGPGSAAQTLPFVVSSVSTARTWALDCTLPGHQNGALSHVTSIGLTGSGPP